MFITVASTGRFSDNSEIFIYYKLNQFKTICYLMLGKSIYANLNLVQKECNKRIYDTKEKNIETKR